VEPAQGHRVVHGLNQANPARETAERYEARRMLPLNPWQDGGAPLAQKPCCLATGNTLNRGSPERRAAPGRTSAFRRD
jgi:hypothetical protein